MEKLKDINKFNRDDLKRTLLKDYVNALKSDDFKALVTKLKITEDVAINYTSKLEMTTKELNNCSHCSNLNECKNKVRGCVYFPKQEDNRLSFDYVACKYQKEAIEQEKKQSIVFEEPLVIKNARFKDIDLTDKNRIAAIKWIKKFYKEYSKNPNLKGLYLHGTFGTGKSFLVASLFNELASNGVKATMCYYPEMLRKLKESFSDDFGKIMETLKKSDILLIDDIGAETVSSWSRDEILGTILQYRMDENLPTFFTSNLSISELETHLSQTKDRIDILKAKRIIERIKYLTEDIEMISENRRV